MKFGLSDTTIEKINSVFSAHPEVDKVIIYGSRALGTFRNGSDIDITLFGDKIDYNLLVAISQELDELNTPYLFDISIYHDLQSPDLENHIDRVGLLLYQKQ